MIQGRGYPDGFGNFPELVGAGSRTQVMILAVGVKAGFGSRLGMNQDCAE